VSDPNNPKANRRVLPLGGIKPNYAVKIRTNTVPCAPFGHLYSARE